MGERADEIAGANPLGEGDSVSAQPGDEEIAATRAEIAQTRAEMSETIDAIEAKLSPDHLGDQAKESVKQATVGKVRQTMETIRQTAVERVRVLPRSAQTGGGAVIQRVKQRPLPVLAVVVTVAGLAIGVKVIQGRRQPGMDDAPPSATREASEALTWVQRTWDQIVEQIHGAATRIKGNEQAQTVEPAEREHHVETLSPSLMDRVRHARHRTRPRGWRRSPTSPRLPEVQEEPPLNREAPFRGWRGSPESPTYWRSTGVKRLALIISIALPVVLLVVKKFRPSAGQERTMTRKDVVMAWLDNAYAMETGLVLTLQSHAKDAQDFPELQARIQQHVDETRRHAGLVRGCIERLGGRTSGLKQGMATVVGKAQGVAMRPAQDRVVKNALADASAEQLEISSYRALMAAAQDLGDQETVLICQQILEDEEDMARFLAQQLPTVVTETMNRLPAETS